MKHILAVRIDSWSPQAHETLRVELIKRYGIELAPYVYPTEMLGELLLIDLYTLEPNEPISWPQPSYPISCGYLVAAQRSGPAVVIHPQRLVPQLDCQHRPFAWIKFLNPRPTQFPLAIRVTVPKPIHHHDPNHTSHRHRNAKE